MPLLKPGPHPDKRELKGFLGVMLFLAVLACSLRLASADPPTTTVARLGGAQVLIDVTGEGNDVLKRISARVPLTNNTFPDNTLQSMDTICKRFKIPTTGPNDAILDDPNLDNACQL